MKNRNFFFVFLLTIPFAAHAQNDEKVLVDRANAWVETNLKCKDYSAKRDENQKLDDAPLVNCKVWGRPLFCHLFSSGSTEVVLHAYGPNGWEAGGITDSDDKYILFSLSGDKLNANVFFPIQQAVSGSGGEKIVRLSQGLDSIIVYEGGKYCGISEAHIFSGVEGEIKNVLNYDYLDQCHQSECGFETLLIPTGNQVLKLMKFTKTAGIGGMGDPDIGFSRTYYKFDSSKEAYVRAQEEEKLPLGKGALDWFVESFASGKKGIRWSGNYNKQIVADKSSLQELISNLKDDDADPRRKCAHHLLVEIAGKDLGEGYDVWEEWSKVRKDIQNDSR